MFQQPNDISAILGTETEDSSTITSSITSVMNKSTNPTPTCKYSAYNILVGGRIKVLKKIPDLTYQIKNMLKIKMCLFIPSVIEREHIVVTLFSTYGTIVKHTRK